MTHPLIIAAFGTSSTASATYTHLDSKLKQHFSEDQIFWTYSSRKITRNLQALDCREVVHPEELLKNLVEKGVKEATVQSLHLFPGKEFHSLVRLAENSGLNCSIGTPLLTSPQDYLELGAIIKPIVNEKNASALLILGHGTDHPIWVAYHCLEKILNRHLNQKIYVGVVEKYPDSSGLIDEIHADGVNHITILPLFLVAGMHFKRDIIGPKEDSWRSRLLKKNISVDIIDCGIGLFPGIENLIYRHIKEAGSS